MIRSCSSIEVGAAATGSGNALATEDTSTTRRDSVATGTTPQSALRQIVHRCLHAVFTVRNVIDAQRHLHSGQCAQHHRLVQIAQVADAEHLASKLAQPTTQR